MFNRILLPLDGSKLAECVLPHLVAIAKIGDPEVQLLRVLEPTGVTTQAQLVDPVDWQIRKAEVSGYLSEVAARLQSAGLRVSTQVYEGKPAERIIEVAHSWNADLLILSSHGQSGLSPWSVSSVVQQVIQRAHRSLMIVRAFQQSKTDLTNLRYHKIFLPLDGSQRAEMPLAVAEVLACNHDGEVLVVHIVQQPQLPRRTSPSPEDLLLINQLIERNRGEALGYLEELKLRLANSGCTKVEFRLETSSKVAGALHQVEEENEIDLTILSAHGYSGDTRWPFGSIVVGFIFYGTAPLLILQDLPADRIELTRAEIAAREMGSH
jgi:nucleotide-binding universal stress UspA family protein